MDIQKLPFVTPDDAAKQKDEVREAVQELFTYKDWSPEAIERGVYVKNKIAGAYIAILENVPACPSRTRALNSLIDVRMLANAAITHSV